jgi:hypothetical protein
MSTARIHIVAKDDPPRPLAYRDALDCSPPFKLALAISRLTRRASANARGR